MSTQRDELWKRLGIAEVGAPTPEEAFQAGVRMGAALRREKA